MISVVVEHKARESCKYHAGMVKSRSRIVIILFGLVLALLFTVRGMPQTNTEFHEFVYKNILHGAQRGERERERELVISALQYSAQ